ncbi:MAG: glycerol kinase [Polaribacter sp.]|jgi:glycerol kinase
MMILSIDQGTTGTTVFIFDHQGQVVVKSYNEFTQIYPRPSWVEHDAEEIWRITLKTIRQALNLANIKATDLSCIGITNQRETTVLWDKRTGKPVHNAIVWQCRRSSKICEKIKSEDKESWFRIKTGLVVDAYFSATKIKWLFDNKPEIRKLADENHLAFGTIDTWLIWNLTNGKSHKTDHTNASRTMLYNIIDKSWDNDLLEYFGFNPSMLPSIQTSASSFGHTSESIFFNAKIPITGVAGDQQSALFGRQCTQLGQVKNTYGTGCFLLMYIGETPKISDEGLLTTIACDTKGDPVYALEGSVFNAGSTVQWLRDELCMIESASQTESIALSIENTKNVYLVPAFTGLGAPYWDMNARGVITGLTRGAGKKEIVRAALESIAYQSKDVVDLMEHVSGIKIEQLQVDGGACQNNFLMQFQADILNTEIYRPKQVESTAVGAALLAGIGGGIWQPNQLPNAMLEKDLIFKPTMSITSRREKVAGWKNAIQKARTD